MREGLHRPDWHPRAYAGGDGVSDLNASNDRYARFVRPLQQRKRFALIAGSHRVDKYTIFRAELDFIPTRRLGFPRFDAENSAQKVVRRQGYEMDGHIVHTFPSWPRLESCHGS